MKEIDLVRSLDWLLWVRNAHIKGYSQERIDKHALNRLYHFKEQLSTDVRDIFEDALADAFKRRSEGNAEKSMMAACETVVCLASEEDWKQYVLPYEDQARTWRPIWDSVRNKLE